MLRKLITALCLSALLACPADAVTGTRRVLLSGNVLWTPLNLGTSLVAWWDAQYLPNLTLSVGAASAWLDRKSGILAVQATGAKQPVWSATARNGKPGLTFTASSSQTLTFTPAGFPTGSSAVSIFIGAFGSGAQAFGTAFAYGTAAGNQTFRFRTNVSGIAEYSNGVLSLDGSTWVNVDSAATVTIPAGASPTVTLFQDGNAGAAGAAATQNLTTGGAAIGAIENGSSNFWNGVIQQIVVTSNALTTCQRQKLEGWESWYDGKSGANLPSGHPYKNSAPVTRGAC